MGLEPEIRQKCTQKTCFEHFEGLSPDIAKVGLGISKVGASKMLEPILKMSILRPILAISGLRLPKYSKLAASA